MPEVVGERKVAVQAWPGPGDSLQRAMRGPFRAVIWERTNFVGGSRDLWKCRHRHPTTDAAFECGKAALAGGQKVTQ